MADHRPRRRLAPIVVVAIAAGLLTGFGLGRLTAPSDLERLSNIIGAAIEGPSQSAPPEGVDNDGAIVLVVGADGRLDVEGLRFVEQTGEITFGVGNRAAEPVLLYVEQESSGGSGEWEVIYSEEIAAAGQLVGRLSIEAMGSYRIAVALESAPDAFSIAPLTVWQPE